MLDDRAGASGGDRLDPFPSVYADQPDASGDVRGVIEEFDQPCEGEFDLRRADGTRVPVLASARQMDGEHNALRLVTMFDLSRQKKTEADLSGQYEIVT